MSRKSGIRYTLVFLCGRLLAGSAAALAESEVQTVLAQAGREKVAGNLLIWFLCAVAFLKVSQKLDGLLSSLGLNVGRSGGSILGELMVAGRALGTAAKAAAGGRTGTPSKTGEAGRRPAARADVAQETGGIRRSADTGSGSVSHYSGNVPDRPLRGTASASSRGNTVPDASEARGGGVGCQVRETGSPAQPYVQNGDGGTAASREAPKDPVQISGSGERTPVRRDPEAGESLIHSERSSVTYQSVEAVDGGDRHRVASVRPGDGLSPGGYSPTERMSGQTAAAVSKPGNQKDGTP